MLQALTYRAMYLYIYNALVDSWDAKLGMKYSLHQLRRVNVRYITPRFSPNILNFLKIPLSDNSHEGLDKKENKTKTMEVWQKASMPCQNFQISNVSYQFKRITAVLCFPLYCPFQVETSLQSLKFVYGAQYSDRTLFSISRFSEF